MGALSALAGLITLLLGLKQVAVNVDITAQVAAAELKRPESEVARVSREQESPLDPPGAPKPWA